MRKRILCCHEPFFPEPLLSQRSCGVGWGWEGPREFPDQGKAGPAGSGAPRELPKREMLSATPQGNQVSGWVVCADSTRSKFDDNL